MAATSVTVRVDYENNTEAWWDAFRAALPGLQDSDPELYSLCLVLDRGNEIEITDPAAIERFDRFVTGLPGWADEDAPEYAQNPLVFHAN